MKRQCACDLELRGRMLWFFTELAHYQDIESVHTYFEANFASLFETSLSLFYKVVPIAFTHLPQFCSGNLKMVDLVVKFMDPFGVRIFLKKIACSFCLT